MVQLYWIQKEKFTDPYSSKKIHLVLCGGGATEASALYRLCVLLSYSMWRGGGSNSFPGSSFGPPQPTSPSSDPAGIVGQQQYSPSNLYCFSLGTLSDQHGAIQEDCSPEFLSAPTCFPVRILPGSINSLFLARKELGLFCLTVRGKGFPCALLPRCLLFWPCAARS